MMREVIVATLAFAPLMLQAQANMPAQPQAAVGETTAGSIRISTGPTLPKLIYSVDVEADPIATWSRLGSNCKFVVAMTVDKTGKPANLRMIQSPSKEIDKNVLAAVSQYRFMPGTVSNQPTATPLTLEVDVFNPSR
jgi:TonB family protein